MSLRLPDSGTAAGPDGRRLPPSAERNAGPILEALRAEGLHGRVLEIASGSGYHAARITAALPGLIWQPTDLDPANLASIAAWTAGTEGALPPVVLDAAHPGWHRDFPAQEAAVIINLLHLISETAAQVVLSEAARVLAPEGRLFLYGPFLREGLAISEGDAAFDASLRAQDPAIGYKDIAEVEGWMRAAGLSPRRRDMPANNLLVIGTKTNS
jgi:SAM-dependent methyltransferase